MAREFGILEQPMAFAIQFRYAEDPEDVWEDEEVVTMLSEAERAVRNAPPGVRVRALPLVPVMDEAITDQTLRATP